MALEIGYKGIYSVNKENIMKTKAWNTLLGVVGILMSLSYSATARPLFRELLSKTELEQYIEQGLCNLDRTANQGALDQAMQPKIDEALRESDAAIQELGHAEAALNRKRQKGVELRNAINVIGRLKNRVEELCSPVHRTANSCSMVRQVKDCAELNTFMNTATQISKDAEEQLPPRLKAVEQRVGKIEASFRNLKKWF